mmetsp:Transcript_1409/g.3870  ORF Transcript_1409/g.3870 Transcript_1409/m.3870 type:complete len:100 (-) Transcript_1409:562-861(-)
MNEVDDIVEENVVEEDCDVAEDIVAVDARDVVDDMVTLDTAETMVCSSIGIVTLEDVEVVTSETCRWGIGGLAGVLPAAAAANEPPPEGPATRDGATFR